MNWSLIVAAAGALVVTLLWLCRCISKAEERQDAQRAMDTKAAEDWLQAHQEDRYRTMRRERLHMLDCPRYKPAVHYVSPERTEQRKVANVTKLLRRKS